MVGRDDDWRQGNEIEDIHEEIKNEALNDFDPKNRPEGRAPAPILYVLALFFGLSVVLMAVPYYGITPDVEPTEVPALEDLIDGDMPEIERPEGDDIRLYIDSTDPLVKQTALRVATAGCGGEEICQARAVYYFVRDNFDYVGEQEQYIQTPVEMLYTGGGDCKDFSVLLASMQRAIGIPVRLVFIPGHVYVQIYLQEAPNRYKTGDGWIPLEGTCRGCNFGELPRKHGGDTTRIVWV